MERSGAARIASRRALVRALSVCGAIACRARSVRASFPPSLSRKPYFLAELTSVLNAPRGASSPEQLDGFYWSCGFGPVLLIDGPWDTKGALHRVAGVLGDSPCHLLCRHLLRGRLLRGCFLRRLSHSCSPRPPVGLPSPYGRGGTQTERSARAPTLLGCAQFWLSETRAPHHPRHSGL